MSQATPRECDERQIEQHEGDTEAAYPLTRRSDPPAGEWGPGLGRNRRTAEVVGGGAALGTVIGAAAGGGKGAALGGLAGAAAGALAQVLTAGKEVKIPAESVLKFKLDEPVQLQAAATP